MRRDKLAPCLCVISCTGEGSEVRISDRAKVDPVCSTFKLNVLAGSGEKGQTTNAILIGTGNSLRAMNESQKKSSPPKFRNILRQILLFRSALTPKKDPGRTMAEFPGNKELIFFARDINDANLRIIQVREHCCG